MREAIQVPLRLGIMMLVAALCMSITYTVTKEPIARQQAAQSEKLRLAVMPEASGFEVISVPDAPKTIRSVYREQEGHGYVFEVDADGFGGLFTVTVGIDDLGTVTGVRIGSHKETPGLGAKATEESFYGQYANEPASPFTVVKIASDAGDIQAITAATVTSSAVTDAVNTAITCYELIAGK